jgi:hypothetical protein
VCSSDLTDLLYFTLLIAYYLMVLV